MVSKNKGYDGNTMFFNGELKDNKYYVERIYYDSPREDCNGYYSDLYEYDTPKEAYKAAERWCRTNEPECGHAMLKSTCSLRRYEILVSSYNNDNFNSVLQTYDIKIFLKELKFWREFRWNLRKSGKGDFLYKINII